MRRLLTATTLLAVAALPSRASAQTREPGPDYLTAGLSLSIKLCCNHGGAVGFGPALSYAHGLSDGTVGGFAWLAYYPGLGGTRLGLGPQASSSFAGVEVGPSAFIDATGATTAALSVTPFASIGFVWTGVRFNFGASRASPWAELVLGAGYPILLAGRAPSYLDTGSGRPIRVRGQRRTSGTRVRVGFALPLRPALPGSARRRRALAGHWQREAELEYSSVAAFEHLARQLFELGAPCELVRRCRAAARDETKHARMCYGLASAYAGRALGPRPLDLRDLEPELALSQLVYETVLDGCLGEAIASATARERLAEERDPVVQKVLRAIVRDEAEHARLAWSIVAWSGEAGAMAAGLAWIEGCTLQGTSARVRPRVVERLRRTIASVPQRMAA